MTAEMVARWVPVSVPEEMVPEVMEAVLERIATQPSEDGLFGGWTEDELRDVLRNPTRSVGIVLRYMATHFEEKVYVPKLAEEVYGEGATSNQIGGALGSFTRRIKKYNKDKWPFEVRYDDEREEWYYWMEEETAEVIRRILAL